LLLVAGIFFLIGGFLDNGSTFTLFGLGFALLVGAWLVEAAAGHSLKMPVVSGGSSPPPS
jgi:hypothetical protein